MRFPTNFSAYLYFLFLTTFPCGHSFAATKAAKPKATKVTLPDAYSGVRYSQTIQGLMGLANGELTCSAPTPAFPVGLSLDCSGSKGLVLSGIPTTTNDQLRTYVIQITDVKKNTIELDLTLTLRPAQGIVVAGETLKPTPPAPPDSPPDYSNVKIQPTSVMQEEATTATGIILGLPAKGPVLNIRAWITNLGRNQTSLAQLKPPASSTGTTPVTQVPIGSDGSYLLNFVNPLAAGQTVRLALVKTDGTELPASASYSISLPLAIEFDHLSLEINSEAVAGATTISGHVGMPNPAIAPNTSATPPSYGNYPQIVVWIKDPVVNQWFQATLQTGTGTTGLFSPVTSDGSFSVTLKNALTSGQEVEVRVVPPPGRSFVTAANPHPTDQGPTRAFIVPTNALLMQPSIATILTEGVTTISGTATPSGANGTFSVAVLNLKPLGYMVPNTDTSICITTDELTLNHLEAKGKLMSLTSSSSNVLLGSVDTSGTYKVTLAEALREDEEIQVLQVLPAGSVVANPQQVKCASQPERVRYPFDWDRTNLTFVAGVLLSNSSATSATNADFSQANAFFALNLDRAWRLPGADYINGYPFGRTDSSRHFVQDRQGWHAFPEPGINTFFEGRLTSIPVSTASASSPPPSTTSGSSPSSSASTTTSATTLLTSQKTFLVSVGAFLPWVLTHGDGRNPTGLFAAPLAKVGFDTITGAAQANNVILSDGTVGTLDYERAYNYFVFGGRVGNMRMSASPNRAPQIEQHLDVTIGRFGNLQSFICHNHPAPLPPTNGAPVSDPAGSSCRADYPSIYPNMAVPVVQSRKELYRLDIEGLVKIPIPATAIPFYIGFNANIAQHTLGAAALDHGFAPPDDIRILFGTKFDMGSLLSKLNLAPSQ